MLSLRTTLLASVLIFGTSVGANATVIQVSSSFGPGTTDFTKAFSIAGFDSTLGTLTGVSAIYTVSATEGGTVKNVAANAQNFKVTESIDIILQSDGTLGTSNVTGLNGNTLSLTASQSYVLEPGQSSAFGPFTPSQSSTTVLADLNDFLASSINLSARTLTGTLISGGGGNILSNITTQAGGTLTLEYTYTASTVPEPASMALLGMGLMGLGFARRKKA